jgi:hypothetical protein
MEDLRASALGNPKQAETRLLLMMAVWVLGWDPCHRHLVCSPSLARPAAAHAGPGGSRTISVRTRCGDACMPRAARHPSAVPLERQRTCGDQCARGDDILVSEPVRWGPLDGTHRRIAALAPPQSLQCRLSIAVAANLQPIRLLHLMADAIWLGWQTLAHHLAREPAEPDTRHHQIEPSELKSISLILERSADASIN